MADAAGPAAARDGAALAAPPGRLANLLFWAFWLVVGGLLRIALGVRVENRPRLRGAFVLAANHASFLDPILIGAVMRRRVAFLMTEIIWRSPTMGWFYRWNRAIPVSARGRNREALRAARRVLQQGRVLGIFPEGGLSRDGGLLLGNPGAVSLVLGESVPIVPVGIAGAATVLPPGARWPRRRGVTLRFGAPVSPAELIAVAGGDRKERLQAATTSIMERIAALTHQQPREHQVAACPPAAT